MGYLKLKLIIKVLKSSNTPRSRIQFTGEEMKVGAKTAVLSVYALRIVQG